MLFMFQHIFCVDSFSVDLCDCNVPRRGCQELLRFERSCFWTGAKGGQPRAAHLLPPPPQPATRRRPCLQGVESLAAALQGFAGAVLLVSHDQVGWGAALAPGLICLCACACSGLVPI